MQEGGDRLQPEEPQMLWNPSLPGDPGVWRAALLQ
jgi:hypothetical protein